MWNYIVGESKTRPQPKRGDEKSCESRTIPIISQTQSDKSTSKIINQHEHYNLLFKNVDNYIIDDSPSE